MRHLTNYTPVMVTKIMVVAMMIDECDIDDEENNADAVAAAYDDDCAGRRRRSGCEEGVIVDRPIQLTQSQIL